MTGFLNRAIEKLTAKNYAVFFFLFGVTLFAYGNILLGGFVFDDNIFIQNNATIRSLGNIGTIYSSSTTAGSGLVGDNFYRPNQQFAYAVLYYLFGLTPFFFHFTSLLFHVVNGFLVFVLLYKLGLQRRTALVGSLLFLLHPILTEAVSYVSGLSDPMVTVTILLTLLIFLRYLKEPSFPKSTRWLLAGVAVFFAGLFSKENQIVSLGLLAALAVFEYKKGRLGRVFPVFVFIGALSIMAALYLYARLTILNFTGIVGLTPDINGYTQNVWVRLATFVHILPEYFKMMLFPWHLYYEKPYDAYGSLSGVRSVLGMVALVSAGAFAVYALAKKHAGTVLALAFSLSWFFMALSPVSGIVPVNAMYLEHWLYLPFIGIIFCLCFLAEKLPPRAEKVLPCLVMLVLLVFTGRIVARNREWGDPIRFYTNELHYTQSSARIYTDLGMEEAERGNCDAAILHYRQAIVLSDTYPQTHHNMARCLEHEGKLQEAADEYLKALSIQPDFIYSLSGLSGLLSSTGDTRGARFLELLVRVQRGQSVVREDVERALAR